MDETNKYSAFAAATEAHALLASARKHLMGQRLPLAGTQCDLDRAASELRAAGQKIDEALRAVEAFQTDPGAERR